MDGNDLDELLEASSLGSPAARYIREHSQEIIRRLCTNDMPQSLYVGRGVAMEHKKIERLVDLALAARVLWAEQDHEDDPEVRLLMHILSQEDAAMTDEDRDLFRLLIRDRGGWVECMREEAKKGTRRSHPRGSGRRVPERGGPRPPHS